MTKIEVVRGLVMPFFPMRPMPGRTLKTPKLVSELYAEIQEPDDWVCQPKLGGDRACLALVDGKVYIQNRHGGWYGHPVNNVGAFLKLPDRTVLDGEVYKGDFYAFDALVVAKQSFTFCTAAEREVMALQMMRLINQPWLFNTPSKEWLLKRREHMPKFEGVVLKRSNSPYVILGSDHQFSPAWIKRVW